MSNIQPTFLARSSTIWEDDNNGLRGAKRGLYGYRQISRVLIPRQRKRDLPRSPETMAPADASAAVV